eukprot:g8713.t1
MSAAIDPALYTKLFEVNKPCWAEVSDALANLQKSGSIPEDAKILDLGAGPAEPTATILAAHPKLNVTCTDSQGPMIEKGKMRCEKKLAGEVTSGIEFGVANAEDLSQYGDNSFDVVVGTYLLMFVDCAKCLGEVKRVLKPGGCALFSVWLDMPFFKVNQQMVNEVWADLLVKKTADGSSETDAALMIAPPPKLLIQPLTLSPTEYNTKGDVGALAKKAGFLDKKVGVKDMKYDWHMNADIDTLCSISNILTGAVMPGMAQKLGISAEELDAKYQAKMKQEITEKYPGWKVLYL